MSDQVWIALIIVGGVVVVLYIFRRQLKDFMLRVTREGVDAGLSTHDPGKTNDTAARGVSVSGNTMLGWLQRIFVRHDDAEVTRNVMGGGRQAIDVEGLTPRATYLYQQIALNFSVNDFRTLCVAIGEDYAALPGDTLDAKARALLTRAQRQQRLPAVVAEGRAIHPDLPWEI
jgi:hypothetical protein